MINEPLIDLHEYTDLDAMVEQPEGVTLETMTLESVHGLMAEAAEKLDHDHEPHRLALENLQGSINNFVIMRLPFSQDYEDHALLESYLKPSQPRLATAAKTVVEAARHAQNLVEEHDNLWL